MAADRRDESKPDRRHILPRPGGRRETDPPEDVEALLALATIEAAAAERLIDAAVVAREMGVTGQTIRNWIEAQRIIGVRTATGRYRVPLFELVRLRKGQKSQTRQP